MVEAGGEGVGEGVAFAGVAGPAGGGVPSGAVASGVDVDADEDDVGFAEGGAVGVDAADAFFEGDVFGFGDEEDEHKKGNWWLADSLCKGKDNLIILNYSS